MQTVDRIVEVLEEAGIDHVFGIPGGDTGRIYKALYHKQDKIKSRGLTHQRLLPLSPMSPLEVPLSRPSPPAASERGRRPDRPPAGPQAQVCCPGAQRLGRWSWDGGHPLAHAEETDTHDGTAGS